ncbi:hypothetical protein WJX73_002801 [Symbiochloris irregularis]|uniref:Uncharacterized protein n=1 Tax=Symbiochloris irregularis TaxID=706552 RepID=A0AAW1PY83_9CHLO
MRHYKVLAGYFVKRERRSHYPESVIESMRSACVVALRLEQNRPAIQHRQCEELNRGAHAKLLTSDNKARMRDFTKRGAQAHCRSCVSTRERCRL